jgi:hypothetical protein
MNVVQNLSNSECNTQLSEPFRVYLCYGVILKEHLVHYYNHLCFAHKWQVITANFFPFRT